MQPPVQIPIAVTRTSGPLAIVWLQLVVTDLQGRTRDVEPTPETIEHELTSHFGLGWVSYRIITPEDLPEDRTFRDAWRDRDGRIDVDLDVARSLWRQQIAARARPLLEAVTSRIVLALADGAEGDLDELRARRRALEAASTDLRIDAARSPSELIAIDPLKDLT